MQPNKGPQMPMKLPWHRAQSIHCSCGNKFFTEAYAMKKFPKTTIEIPGEMPFPEDQYVPVSVMICSKCSEILDSILPEEIVKIL